MLLPSPDPAHCFMPYPAVPVDNAPDGPLAGLTFAVKDLFDVAGYPTGGGNPHVLAMSGIKTAHAPVVARLLAAGARFVGKTHTDELAFSLNGQNAHYGAPRNGAAPDRITGGSSSGSASAVSNGLCDFALGTDTGGSVRGPANHCGLYGLRPTHGRISLEGCIDLAPSLDTCGYFARDPAVFSQVGEVLLGADPTPLPERPRWLLAQDLLAMLDPAVRAAHGPGLQRLAACHGAPTPVQALAVPVDTLYWALRHIQGREAWQTDGALIETHALALGPGVKERFAWSRGVTEAQYQEACAVRERWRAALGALLGSDGVLVLPTMPGPAPLRDESEAVLDVYRNDAIRLLCLAGLSGFPQVNVPAGTHAQAPLGLSLIGPAGSDASLVALAGTLG